MTIEVDKRALDKASGALRLSVADVHAVVSAYLEAREKAPAKTPDQIYAYNYGGNWYVIGHKGTKKDLPENVEIIPNG